MKEKNFCDLQYIRSANSIKCHRKGWFANFLPSMIPSDSPSQNPNASFLTPLQPWTCCHRGVLKVFVSFVAQCAVYKTHIAELPLLINVYSSVYSPLKGRQDWRTLTTRCNHCIFQWLLDFVVFKIDLWLMWSCNLLVWRWFIAQMSPPPRYDEPWICLQKIAKFSYNQIASDNESQIEI